MFLVYLLIHECSMFLRFLIGLTMKRKPGKLVCFQITHNQAEYSLNVTSASKIVFEVGKKHLFI